MKRTLVVFAVITLVAAGGALAATDTTTFQVTASVTQNCTISAVALAFGPYDPIVANAAANLDATGGVTITCTKGSNVTIGLDAGLHSANAVGTTRAMSDGGTAYLSYELYQPGGYATVWGASGTALYTPAAAPSKAPRAFTINGRVPAGQDAAVAALYSDTVTATVNF